VKQRPPSSDDTSSIESSEVKKRMRSRNYARGVDGSQNGGGTTISMGLDQYNQAVEAAAKVDRNRDSDNRRRSDGSAGGRGYEATGATIEL